MKLQHFIHCSYEQETEVGALQILYYVLQHVMFCEEFEIFIHFPNWSCDEVHHLLDLDIT
jgi:hypothetical protein